MAQPMRWILIDNGSMVRAGAAPEALLNARRARGTPAEPGEEIKR